MQTPSQDQVDEAVAALDKVRRKWLRRPYVGAVDVGFRIVEAEERMADEVVIRVHLERKLPDAPPNERFPDAVEGVKVDVVEAMYTLDGPPEPVHGCELPLQQGRVDPLMGGVSIGTPNGTSGTLGAVVWDVVDGSPHLLSNWHVLVGSQAATTDGSASGTAAQPHIQGLPGAQSDMESLAALEPHIQGVAGLEPHIQGLAGLEPHIQALAGLEPHIQGLAGLEPHIQGRAGLEPHIQALAEMMPHIQGLAELEPHIQGLAGSEPHIQALAALQPHIQALLRSTTSPPASNDHLHRQTGIGASVYQPGRFDGGTTADTVAQLSRLRLDRHMDAGIARLDGSRPYAPIIHEIGQITGVVPRDELHLGMAVRKFGRSTGLTEGIVDGVSLSTKIELAHGIHVFDDQLHIVPPDPWPAGPDREVSASGDSGAVWVEQEGTRAVALHFAGEKEFGPAHEHALANPMWRVARCLGFSFTPELRRRPAAVTPGSDLVQAALMAAGLLRNASGPERGGSMRETEGLRMLLELALRLLGRGGEQSGS